MILSCRLLKIFRFPLLQPCVAARLFACFTLHQCKQQQQQPQGLASPEEEPQKGRPVRQLNGGMTSAQKSSFDLIIPFINALVDLEMTLLRDDVKPTQRRVHFAAFDGSAMKPPSDVLEGSHRQQQEYIQQLAQVRRAAQDLNNKRILGDLAHFLREPFVLHGYCGLCAESMSKTMTREYPSQRVQKAAESYATDLELLEKDEHSSSQEFSWNRRMADASAQLVRYWLRTILNPVPDRAPPTRSEWNSRVSEIVSLELQQGESTVAIDDGSLSSLVSDALSHIYDYFGDDPNGWRQILDATPSEFCQSEICHRGVAGKQNKMLQLSANAWKTIGQEIELATGFLAAMNGAQFLKDLLTIIIFSRRAQAWQHSITASASILQKCRSSLQREDAHFCLLSLGPKQLLKFLEILVEDYRRQEDCQNQLRDLEKRFWFGLKARNVRRKHEPHLGYLEDYYLQAMASANKFPSVRMSPQGE